ncbi:MAG: RagB/SusD family nutrient uptake outer membrane protein [Saprospiraceae bacterium]
MKLLKHRLLAILLLTIFAASCDSEFLETSPPDPGSVDGFFETQEDVVRALNGVYDVFQGTVWGGAFYIMHPHFDILTDNAVGCCPWEYEYLTIAKGEHNPTTGGVIDAKWDFGYEGIFRANSVLENIANVEMEEGTRTALTAEARFLRAMIHGDLTNLFGGIPLADKVFTREEALNVGRSSEAEVLAVVYADLDFAEANLGMTPFNGQSGRPTKQSAIAVKTRLKLYNGDYAGAAQEAKKLIDMSAANPDIIGLVDNYEMVFHADNENNKEVLFDIQYTEGTQGEGNFIQVMLAPGPEGNPGSGWGSITPLDGLANSFEMTDGLPIDESPLFNADDPYENRDPRMMANLFIPGKSTWRGEVYDESLSGFSPFFAIRKWVDLDATIGEDACACNETNMILYRYSDILLMFAEAQNELSGPDADVYDAINAVRTRAGMPALAEGMSQGDMRDAIRHERQVEFPWEGTRYFDLVRWDMAKEKVPDATLFGESRDARVFDPSKHNLWPIPQKEIDLNPNLTQNPGF